MAETSESLDDPNTLHEYKVLGELGEGGFSQVYKIKHRETGHKYALKKIDIRNLKLMRLFHCMARERRAARELTDSQWVVRIYSTFVVGNILNIIMELVPNGNFYDHVLQTRGFSCEVTKFYAAELVLALEYLRSKNWVHRDMKLENLIFDQNWHLKLADFGISKKIGEQPGSPDEQKPSTNIGTIGYKAPEVYLKKPTTFSTDLWGLGICIYIMYMARDPFDQLTPCFIYRNVMRGTYRRLPTTADRHIRDILSLLLVPDDEARLGADNLENLKRHPLFEHIRWEVIHTLEPPAIKRRSHYNVYPRIPPPPPPRLQITVPKNEDTMHDTTPLIGPRVVTDTGEEDCCGIFSSFCCIKGDGFPGGK